MKPRILAHCAVFAAALIASPVAGQTAVTPQTPQTDTSSSAHAGGAAERIGQPPLQEQAAVALDPAKERRARSLNLKLRCPVCQSSSIEESPSQEAIEMKAVVREQVAAGKSDDEIEAYFVSKYGDWVLLEPPRRGANLIVYLLPLAVVLLGGVYVFRTAKKWTREPAEN